MAINIIITEKVFKDAPYVESTHFYVSYNNYKHPVKKHSSSVGPKKASVTQLTEKWAEMPLPGNSVG